MKTEIVFNQKMHQDISKKIARGIKSQLEDLKRQVPRTGEFSHAYWWPL